MSERAFTWDSFTALHAIIPPFLTIAWLLELVPLRPVLNATSISVDMRWPTLASPPSLVECDDGGGGSGRARGARKYHSKYYVLHVWQNSLDRSCNATQQPLHVVAARARRNTKSPVDAVVFVVLGSVVVAATDDASVAAAADATAGVACVRCLLAAAVRLRRHFYCVVVAVAETVSPSHALVVCVLSFARAACFFKALQNDTRDGSTLSRTSTVTLWRSLVCTTTGIVVDLRSTGTSTRRMPLATVGSRDDSSTPRTKLGSA